MIPTSTTSTSAQPRALRELARIRAVSLDAGDKRIDLVTRRSPLQVAILEAFGVDTTDWSRARIA